MWPLFQPIRTLKILKLCEISWDLLKKYFHLKSNAVYNSSAKNGPRRHILRVPPRSATGNTSYMYKCLKRISFYFQFTFLFDCWLVQFNLHNLHDLHNLHEWLSLKWSIVWHLLAGWGGETLIASYQGGIFSLERLLCITAGVGGWWGST